MNLLFNLFTSVLSKIALRSRYLQFRGSFIVYIVMKSIAKFYKVLFFACDDIVVSTVWGARFRLPKSRSFAENRYLSLMLGMVEPQWKDYFDRYIVESRVFLDIGAAGDGYYTVRACKLNPRIKCVAVEPLPTEYRYLLLNIDLNSCSNRVIPINVALGEEQRVIELSRQKVKCVTLDSLLQNLKLPSVDIIKIDVEGAGAEIIKGGCKTIQRHKPIIFFEVHNISEKQMIHKLRNIGYKAIERHGEMYILLPSISRQANNH